MKNELSESQHPYPITGQNFGNELEAVEGLYLHVPFCISKCSYCAFYSLSTTAAVRREFLHMPAAELAKLLRGKRLRPITIYFGGGTPSLLGGAGMERLVASLQPHLSLARLREWSVEVNPDSVTKSLARSLQRLGVTRVTMGVQSFDDATLRRIKRSHDAAAVPRALRLLREGGIRRLGIDLIASLPGVTERVWRETLARALDMDVGHISLYSLILEPFSELAREVEAGLRLADDEAQLAALAQAEELLSAAGYRRYEISNYARPGEECLHNLSCWRGEDYLGLGPGAHSRVGRWRWSNRCDLARYNERLGRGMAPAREFECLERADEVAERFLFGLRTDEGVSPRAFARRRPDAAQHVGEWERKLTLLEWPGIVVRYDEGAGGGGARSWRLTARGREVADAVIRELL